MLKSKSFLAIDFGASNLKVAEFEVSDAGGLMLRQYGLQALGQEAFQEGGREPALLRALQELMATKNFTSKQVNVCAPGFNTFSKFVKLPPVDTSKVTQIIQYEAQQNVPFPLEEVVWDYQILGAAASGELEVLLVAIKTDVVEGLFRVIENAGLRLQLADVSPAALCNAFRYNYGDLEGCTMLLDIGAKTSNLIFFQNGSVYSRGINIGAQAITQDFARESRLAFPEAERIKIEEGFVSLGGAYEEPENPNQAAISKIARQVMTRLHIQVNQTVQYYRGQQGGSAPDRLFLAGGASIMPYTAQFFSEKLNVAVEYFNPLRNVEIDPELDREELVKFAHSLGEAVGLGLRNLAHCPVELNLMPASSLRRQELNQKKPYFIVSLCSLILVLFAFGWFYHKVASQKAKALLELQAKVGPLQRNESTLRGVTRDLKNAQGQLDQYTTWLQGRFYWPQVLMDLRQVLLEVEAKQELEFKQEMGGQPDQEFKAKIGVWIERLVPATATGPLDMGPGAVAPGPMRRPSQTDAGKPAPPVVAKATGLAALLGGTSPPPSEPALSRPSTTSSTVATNAITHLQLFCRGVSLKPPDAPPDANTRIAFAVAKALQEKESLVDPEGTELFGQMTEAENELTFTFQVNLKLKNPFSF